MIEAMGIILIFSVVIIFLVYPKRCTKEQEKIIRGRNYAHRGLHNRNKTVPENSISAFKLAVENGYGIELDVTLSKDGEVMVFHDEKLNRVVGVEGRLEEYLAKDLKEMNLFNTDEKIPKLKEILEIVKGEVPVIIEIKSGERNKELCEKVFHIIKEYKGYYCIESFNPCILLWFRKNAPQIMRGILIMNRKNYTNLPSWIGFLMSNALTNVISRPNFIAHDIFKKSFLLKFSEKLGAMKVVWTVDNKMNYKKYEAENHAVIFEFYKPKPKYN